MKQPETAAPLSAGALVRQMESLWQQGQKPDADALLRAAGVSSPLEVAEVLAADQWQRWHAGERIFAEDYLARHPAVAADPAAALVLVYGEFLVREEQGEAPSPPEYLARFPHCADGLRRQLDFHAAVGEASPTVIEPAKGPRMGVPLLPLPLVPGYELLREIGQGGMGIVYLARHTRLDRLVALKMIRAGHADEAHLIRFETETQAIARLQHPNIVQVYEVGEHQGMPFFSLELCEGGALAQKLAGAPQPPRHAAELVATLARAMHCAHQRHVVHRDLTPANVLLGADGTPKITDFGLAKKLDEAGQTQTGLVMGTPSYMAPEQARGSKDVGLRADVYALGAILYECLTGRPPFKGADPFDTLVQVVSEEPIAPRQLNTRLPPDLETICLMCLRKEANKRYASAQELADDLGRWLDGEPVRPDL